MYWQELPKYWSLSNKVQQTTKLECPLVLTFCLKRSNYINNKPQERALRIAYNDCNSSSFKLLEITNEKTINIWNLKVLFTKIYKFVNGLSPPILNEVLQISDALTIWQIQKYYLLNLNLPGNMALIQLPLRFFKFDKMSSKKQEIGNQLAFSKPI